MQINSKHTEDERKKASYVIKIIRQTPTWSCFYHAIRMSVPMRKCFRPKCETVELYTNKDIFPKAI